MSVLLRQPHGFEGLLPLPIHALAHEGPVADRKDVGGTCPHLDSVTPPKVNSAGHNHVLTDLNEFVMKSILSGTLSLFRMMNSESSSSMNR